MSSGKKRRLKKCHKCVVPLTKWNWSKCDRKIGHYICLGCRKGRDRRRHNSDLEFKKKRLDRYRMRRSAVIFSYGNECAKCQEDNYSKLTMCKINGGRVDINFLYNNVVDKINYQVLCYNCRCTKENKDQNKKAAIVHYGGCCSICNEDKLERLTLDCKTSANLYRKLVKEGFTSTELKVLCFNCYNDSIYQAKYPQVSAKELNFGRH